MNGYLQQQAYGNGSGKVEKRTMLDLGFQREPCRFQVYSSREVAENMVLSLKAMGIIGEVRRCLVCRLLHVLEYRP